MLLSLTVSNCMIYNSAVEFSMHANMHYRRFPNNLITVNRINALKTAILIGPNNSGKTNFVRIMATLKRVILNQGGEISGNLFSNNPVAEIGVSFLANDTEYLFEIKYDTSKKEYIYERFSEIQRDRYGNTKSSDLLLRDVREKLYLAEDQALIPVMKVAAKNNILVHLLDTESFPGLRKIKETLIAFASRIDIVDMNNIPINKTIEMLKHSDEMQKRIAHFILNADLSLEDYRYLNDDEVRIVLQTQNHEDIQPQEKVLINSVPWAELLHLTSVYKGIPVPSMLYDSTGTKKMAALASYVIDALENGRILIVDELDNSLHFRLTRAILVLFNNELNTSAQLVATVHDISLLDCQTIFRKEQIWFTHKDKEDAYLYSLAEFTAEKNGIRNTSDLIEKYRRGVFGALPEPDLFQSLLEVRSNV